MMDEYVWLTNFPALHEAKLRAQHQKNVLLFISDLESKIKAENYPRDLEMDFCMRDKWLYQFHYHKKMLNVADYGLQTVPIEAYNRFKIYASMCNPCFDEIIHRAYKVGK